MAVSPKLTPNPIVAFEEVQLSSGGSAVPGYCRVTTRKCVACTLKTTPQPTKIHHAPFTALELPLLDLPGSQRRPGQIIDSLGTQRRQEIVEDAPGSQREVVVTPPRLGGPGSGGRRRGEVTWKDEMAAKPDSAVGETYEDRDPNNLNGHVQIVWDDVIGEPEGARSPECAWRLSTVCFKHARNWCYTVLAVIIAPPCALALGCCFACLAFEQIWCTAPCVRCVKIYFASLRTMVQACMATFVVPAAEAVGHLCRHIRVNFRKDAPDERDMLVV